MVITAIRELGFYRQFEPPSPVSPLGGRCPYCLSRSDVNVQPPTYQLRYFGTFAPIAPSKKLSSE